MDWEQLWFSRQIALGLVHELTNYLTAAGDLVGEIGTIAGPAESHHPIDQLKHIIRHCAPLLGQVQGVLSDRPADLKRLNPVVAFSTLLLRHVVNRNVSVRTKLDSSVDRLRADCSRIEEILAVLLIRGREVLRGEGSIEVETGTIRFESSRQTPHAKLAAIEYATVTIRLLGPDFSGSAWATRPRVAVSSGTEIPTNAHVERLLQEIDAQIDVAAEPNYGETITLYLPVTAVEQPLGPRDQQSATLHVLVVDDEPVVRESIKYVLERKGFLVTMCESAEEAVKRLPPSGKVDLLITDVVIGKMNGWEFARLLREKSPAMPIIFISGYAGETGLQLEELDQHSAFLPKPFDRNDLLKAVRNWFADEA